MKFPLAQEVSRHVRDKVCKFYKTTQSATVTCNEEAENSQTSKALITSDTMTNEKVGLDLNFTEILSPSTFRIGEEFAMMIGEVASVEQVVEISFTCKVCDFR